MEKIHEAVNIILDDFNGNEKKITPCKYTSK